MSSNSHFIDFQDRINDSIKRVGAVWLRWNYAQQLLLVCVVLVVKNAADIELRNIQEAYLPGALEFPTAVGYFSGSFGQAAVASLLGVSTTTQWVALHGLLILAGLGVAFWLIWRTGRETRSFLVLALAAATATASLLVSIGKYDVITFLGAVIFALARTTPVAIFGVAVMASGNPEQAIVASVAVLALSGAVEFRHLRARAVIAVCVTGITWGIVQLWFALSGVGVGRLELVPVFLAESLARVITSPGNEIWSWLNAGWLLAVIALFAATRLSRKWLVVALFVLPGLVTIITADGARVFGSVVLAAYLLVALWIGQTQPWRSENRDSVMGLAVIAMVTLPVIVDTPGWLSDLVIGRLAAFF